MKHTFLGGRIVLCLLAVTPAALFAQTAPAKPAPAPKDREPVKDMFTLSLMYWKPSGQPGFRAGQFIEPTSRHLDFTSGPRPAMGFMLTFPTGSFNRLEIGAWRIQDSGTIVTPNKLSIFGANVPAGDHLDTKYNVTNIRFAWNYLTFPAPPFDAKLRIKTFWEFQYTRFSPTIGFPDAKDSPLPITPKQSIKYPGVGLGLEYRFSKNFRFEGRGSGMGLPKRSGYYDLEGTFTGRIKSVEFFAGAKAFHFHVSPRKVDARASATFWGPMVGLRYVIW